MKKLIFTTIFIAISILSNTQAGILDDLKKEGVRVNLNNEICKSNQVSNEAALERFIYLERTYAVLDGFDKFCGKNATRDLTSMGISSKDITGFRMFVESQIPGCLANTASIDKYRKFQDNEAVIVKLMGCRDNDYFGNLNQLRKTLQK